MTMRVRIPHRCRAGVRCAAALIALLASGCASPDRRGDVVTTDSAGIAIVRHARLAPRVDTLLEPAVRTGSADAMGGAEYAFEYLSDVEVLRDGRVLAVDNRGARAALFDSLGVWLRDLGRRGEGPGEYRMPISAHWRGDTLLLWDIGLRRFTSWLHGDSSVGTVALASPVRTTRLALFGDGVLLQREIGQTMDPAPAEAWLERLSFDDTVVRRVLGPFPVPEYGWEVNEATGNGMMVNPPIFSAAPRWATRDATLAWTSGAGPRIELRDSTGALRRVIISARASRPTGDADRDAYFRGLQSHFGMPDEVIARERASASIAASLPVYVGLVLDDAGRLWAALHDPRSFEGTGTTWDVFDSDGRHTRSVVFGERFALQRVREGKAYGIATTDDGVHTIDIYALPH
jgi:hypothetical protein